MTALRYSRGAMLLHWLIAACFAFQIGLGWRMHDPRGPQTFAIFQLHKSIGITILLLTLVRIAWRLTHRPPPFPPAMARWEKALAHAVHIAFYVVLLAMPLSGWLIVSASPIGVPTMLFGAIPWLHIPGISALAPVAKKSAETIGSNAHSILALGSMLLIALHVLGALKHQLIERRDELARMLPAPPRIAGAAALGLVAALLELMALGRTAPLKPLARVAPAETEAAPPPPAIPASAVAPAVASPPAAAKPVAAAAPSEWVVRRAGSSLRFHTAWSQGPIDGRFDRWDAAIRFDPAALDASSVAVTIDMASAKTGVPDTEGALPGSDWFAVAADPTATYRATRFRARGAGRFEALGALSLRGVARPLALPFTLTIDGDVATMTASARIDRTMFGVGQGEWQTTSDVPASVQVEVTITADRKPR